MYAEPFDYIDSQMMACSLGDWEIYLRKCSRNLNRGGYLEWNESDIIPTSDDRTLAEGSSMLQSSGMIKEAAEIFGRTFREVVGLADLMIGISFKELYIRRFRWPVNKWP
ncbi:hypothetical protein CORC01_10494 [Colletotrichum orchidophilum]|uniref:TAM domain methyltransferase n=1 Tax=Colletotrichum orchidophilum TaxID=1209926 RepID=A0A1G4AYG0_9PEZI|nr:uncharacterized protein CORC01_10494 [Colletotrichum orchidophilum]OHE94156.1 hypothetical protein CORC01_10494 [Colletotrichum orchidophilum]